MPAHQPMINVKHQTSLFSVSAPVINSYCSPFVQSTVAHDILFDGVGVHSGLPVQLTIRPAAPYTGYVFIRTDLDNARIPAVYDAVVDTTMCTKIANKDGISIATIEHVIAALQGVGIANAEIDVSGAEVPIMDGSSCLFTEALMRVGASVQSARQRTLKILAPVRVSHSTGYAEFLPSHERRLNVTFDFGGRLTDSSYGTRFSFDLDHDNFHDLIADARTFGLFEDAIRLQQAGLAKGATLENTVVLKDNAVMNENGLRSNDEMVRHKVLDAIGDLALAGCAIVGTFSAHNPGHGLNNQLLRALFATPQSFTWIN